MYVGGEDFGVCDTASIKATSLREIIATIYHGPTKCQRATDMTVPIL